MILLFLFLIMSSYSLAVNVTSDVIFNDGTYTYTVIDSTTANTYLLNDNFYIDSVNYCDSLSVKDFVTDRNCVKEKVCQKGGTSLFNFGSQSILLSIIIIAIVVIGVLGFYFSYDTNLSIFGLVAIIVSLVIFLLVVAIGTSIISTQCLT